MNKYKIGEQDELDEQDDFQMNQPNKKIIKEPGCIPAVPLTGRFSNEILQFFYENDINMGKW